MTDTDQRELTHPIEKPGKLFAEQVRGIMDKVVSECITDQREQNWQVYDEYDYIPPESIERSYERIKALEAAKKEP